MEYLSFIVLGLGGGALYASLAQGLLMIYKGARVINFGHAAIAAYAAYTFFGLRQGQLMVPPLPNPFALVEGVAGWFGADLKLPHFPPFIHVGIMPFAAAFAISIAISVALGLVLHFLVFNRFRTSPPLARVVA